MIEMDRAKILQLVKDWRNERDPADAWVYANIMAEIIEGLLPYVPKDAVVEVES